MVDVPAEADFVGMGCRPDVALEAYGVCRVIARTRQQFADGLSPRPANWRASAIWLRGGY